MNTTCTKIGEGERPHNYGFFRAKKLWSISSSHKMFCRQPSSGASVVLAKKHMLCDGTCRSDV
jgi:hypothetical protein